MIKLDIWLSAPDGARQKCGEMVATDTDSRGAVQGAFRYTGNYLNHPKAFPLDPVQLTLFAISTPIVISIPSKSSGKRFDNIVGVEYYCV